jgi:hypothetical protein
MRTPNHTSITRRNRWSNTSRGSSTRRKYTVAVGRSAALPPSVLSSPPEPIAGDNRRVNDEWIALRLAVLSANVDGRVRTGLVLWDRAIRAALIVDLALRDRWQSSTPASSIDTSPTGFAPADTLLSYIDSHPNQPMIKTITSAPVELFDLLDPDRRNQRRWRRPRMLALELDLVASERALITDIAQTGRAASPKDAALTVIAGALGKADAAQRTTLLNQCGSLRSLITDIARYLDRELERSEYAAAAGATGGGDG